MSTIARPLVILSLLTATPPALAKDDYVYGPPPVWSEYKALGEAALRATFAQPDAWAVEWPNGYKQGGWISHGHPHGYLTCGIVHAVKPIAGGYPSHSFVVVIDRGAVTGIDFAPKRSSNADILCPGMVARGAFPPASLMESNPETAVARKAANTGGELAIGTLGLSVRAMPDGAYVTSVTTGSPAATAGIVAGMVITKVNGIPLAGMGEAMVKLLTSDTPMLTLETAAGARLEIKRPPL